MAATSTRKKKKHLNIVSDNAETHKTFAGKHFSPHHLVSLSPKTYPQEQFIQSYYEDIPVISQIGSAGTGKTMLAMYCALSDVFDKGTVYEKVIIVRSAVQTRDMGFTSGDDKEKGALYEAPYIPICDEILVFKSNNYENLKAKNMIEFHTTSFLRGLTFDNTIVIVDEAQSMSYHELSTIITRCGANTRIILCGDTKQDDLLKKKNDTSGLPEFLRVLERMPSRSVDIVKYTPNDIVRSGLVKDFLIAEEALGD